jgi:streptogramin lyase
MLPLGVGGTLLWTVTKHHAQAALDRCQAFREPRGLLYFHASQSKQPRLGPDSHSGTVFKALLLFAASLMSTFIGLYFP